MPMRAEVVMTGGNVYASPFVGRVEHTVGIKVKASDFTNKEVDKYGYLLPGVLLTRAGKLPGAGDKSFGVVYEGVKIAKSNGAADLAAAAALEVAVATICQVNTKVVTDQLGRVLTADEKASVVGTPIVLI